MHTGEEAVVCCPFCQLILHLKVPKSDKNVRVKMSFLSCPDCKTPLVALFPQGTVHNCGIMSLDRETMERGDLIAKLCHAADKVQSFLAQIDEAEDRQDGPDLSEDDLLSICCGVDDEPGDGEDEDEGPATVEELYEEVTELVEAVKVAAVLGVIPPITDHDLSVFTALLDSGLNPEDL